MSHAKKDDFARTHDPIHENPHEGARTETRTDAGANARANARTHARTNAHADARADARTNAHADERGIVSPVVVHLSGEERRADARTNAHADERGIVSPVVVHLSGEERRADELARVVRGVADGSCEFDQLVRVLLPLIHGKERLAPEAALELSTALIEIERDTAGDNQLYALVNEHGAAAVALSESGQILALNVAAAELFAVSTGDGLAALRVGRAEFDAFERRLSELNGPTLLRAYAPGPNRRPTPVLLSGVYYPHFRAFVLTALQRHWPRSIDRALVELFDLSRSETEILSALAQGIDSESIARLRGRAVGTVRQQIKSILVKVGTPSQLAAATLAATAAAIGTMGAIASAGANGRGLMPLHAHEAPLRVFAVSRDGRRIGARQFGNPTGAPVLFLHGPSFGAGEYPDDRRYARRYALNVYAMERPGYGRTDSPTRSESILECTYRDTVALLDHAGLQRVTIMAHEVALIPAIELASRQPHRVHAVLGVSSAPPFLALEQIQTIPHHQSVFIHAARHAPWLAHLLVRLLNVRMRRLGPQHWTDVIFRGLANEMAVMGRPELAAGIVGTYSFYLNQMGTGFEHDLKMMLTDWSATLASVAAPLELVHGARNATTPPTYLDVFRTLRPDIRIRIVESAGLTLAVSHPRVVYRTLAALCHQPC